MQSLSIAQTSVTFFELPFQKPFSIGGNFISERVGLYLNLVSLDGISVQGEIAPLQGVSQETLKKARHDIEEVLSYLKSLEIPTQKDDVIELLRKDLKISALCSSARFGIESAIMGLVAKSMKLSLAEFLGSKVGDFQSAALLQGAYEQVIADAKRLKEDGFQVFKLKVGDRNIPLDVKKVNELRAIIGEDGLLRLDGNRVWTLKEALLFAELVGNDRIEFIEEPLSDVSKIDEFYEATHMPIALDETLFVLRCGVTAPGRCSPTLAQKEGVKAYILKPMILGLIQTLDWVEEARLGGRKAIISSSFESAVGMDVLRNLALLTGEVPGLGTERWLK